MLHLKCQLEIKWDIEQTIYYASMEHRGESKRRARFQFILFY